MQFNYEKALVLFIRTVTLFFCLAVFVAYCKFDPFHQTSFDWYYLFLAAALPIPFFLVKTESTQVFFSKKHFILLCVFAVSIFAIRFSHMHTVPFGRDEAEEVSLSANHPPLMACANQSQPPLECALTNFAQTIFGISEFGLRLHIVVLSALSSILLLATCLMSSRSLLASLLIAVAYSAHPLVTQYGYETRPIALGLFSTALLLSWLARFFVCRVNWDRIETARTISEREKS